MRKHCLSKKAFLSAEHAENADGANAEMRLTGFNVTGFRSEEHKKAVAVSEEKIQQRARRRGQFSSSRFLAGKYPNLGRDSISCCRKIGEEFSSSVQFA